MLVFFLKENKDSWKMILFQQGQQLIIKYLFSMKNTKLRKHQASQTPS